MHILFEGICNLIQKTSIRDPSDLPLQRKTRHPRKKGVGGGVLRIPPSFLEMIRSVGRAKGEEGRHKKLGKGRSWRKYGVDITGYEGHQHSGRLT